MICARLIFEIHYSIILNFPLIFREILSPYAKISEDVSITQDTIKFHFGEEGFHISVDSQKISLIWDGNIDILRQDLSLFSAFFDILKILKALPSFGRIKQYRFNTSILEIKEEKFEILRKKFEEKCLNPILLSSFPNKQHFSLSINSKEEEMIEHTSIFLIFDTFIQQNANLLFPISEHEIFKYMDKTGFLYEIRYNQEVKQVESKILKKLIDKSIHRANQLNLLWN